MVNVTRQQDAAPDDLVHPYRVGHITCEKVWHTLHRLVGVFLGSGGNAGGPLCGHRMRIRATQSSPYSHRVAPAGNLSRPPLDRPHDRLQRGVAVA
jgi:hypothetical protein